MLSRIVIAQLMTDQEEENLFQAAREMTGELNQNQATIVRILLELALTYKGL
jgi:hypothetical protein